MDTLSLLVDNIHLRGGRFVDCSLREHAALEMPACDQAAFHVLREGGLFLARTGEAPLAVGSGDIVILPSGGGHRLQAEPDAAPAGSGTLDLIDGDNGELSLGRGMLRGRTVSGYFRFDAELAKPLVAALPALLHIQATGGRIPTWLGLGLQFVDEERRTARPAHQAITDRVADVMFIYCLREYVEQLGEDSGNWLLALRDKSLSAVLAAMHREPGHAWSLRELAAVAASSRTVFAERFTQVVGQPPLTYLTDHRMRLAAWQLRETGQPIYRIAAAVGYSSEAAFSQAFKRFSGVSPRDYRKQFAA